VTFSLIAAVLSFSTYFCMYAFRKPFSVGHYNTTLSLGPFGDGQLKIMLIFFQIIGYTLSKFIGIKVVSESAGANKARLIIMLISVALVALFCFGLTGPSYLGLICLFFNGLPLGMIWGLVCEYLEGRKTSDFLFAALSTSFIVASGAVKSIGRLILSYGINEYWMPFMVGLIFYPLLLLSVYLLNSIPEPTNEEKALRCSRPPMNEDERKLFFKSFAPGLVLFTAFYMILTAFRDFRDNFAREIWDSLGYAASPEIFTLSEFPIAIGCLVLMGSFTLFKDKTTFFGIGLVTILSMLLVGVSTWLFQLGQLDPVLWMVLSGLGLYLAYIPFGCILYDNLMGLLKFSGTAGFMIYVSDAFGYLGSVGLLFYKNFARPNISWLNFFTQLNYVICFVGGILIILGNIYFYRKVFRPSSFNRIADVIHS